MVCEGIRGWILYGLSQTRRGTRIRRMKRIYADNSSGGIGCSKRGEKWSQRGVCRRNKETLRNDWSFYGPIDDRHQSLSCSIASNSSDNFTALSKAGLFFHSVSGSFVM